MKTDDTEMPLKRIIILSSVVSGIGLVILLIGGAYRGIGSVMIFTAIMLWAYRFGLRKLANRFQNRTIPKWERFYEKTLRRALSGAMPYVLTVGIIILLFVAFGGFGYSIGSQRTKVEFFPDNTPNQIIVYIEYPQGTDIEKTNQITK